MLGIHVKIIFLLNTSTKYAKFYSVVAIKANIRRENRRRLADNLVQIVLLFFETEILKVECPWYAHFLALLTTCTV